MVHLMPSRMIVLGTFMQSNAKYLNVADNTPEISQLVVELGVFQFKGAIILV